jgi:tryptophan halogenase
MSQFIPFVKPQQIKLSRTSNGHLLVELLEETEQSTETNQVVETHRFLLDAKARLHLMASLKEVLSQPYLPNSTRSMRHGQPAVFQLPNTTSASSPTSGASVDLATRFTDTLRGLEKPFAFERSIQYQRNQIRAGRLLAGYDLSCPSSLKKQAILELLQQLWFPTDQLDDFEDMLPYSHFLHLGFEPYDDSALYKVYLESECKGDPGNRIRYRAWKFMPFTQQCYITTYTRLPFSSPVQLSQLLFTHFRHVSGNGSFDTDLMGMIQPFVTIAEQCSGDGEYKDIELLHATEDQSLRQSFDMNIYHSDLKVEDMLEDILSMCKILGLDRQRCLLSLRNCLALPLGHVSLGCNRKSDPFFTLYYGASFVI